MPRNVLFFADGTWQDAVHNPPTNVLKLFRALDGQNTLGAPDAPEQEKSQAGVPGKTDHCAKYISGVGTAGNVLENLLGGAIGTGLINNVLRGYTYLSRNWREGDGLFVLGFSRGAYTARTLAGLIAARGLLDWDALGLDRNQTDAQGYGYAARAWRDFLAERHQAAGRDDQLGRIESVVADFADDFRALLVNAPRYIADVRISAVTVFDTVGALGIPEIALRNDTRIDALQFADTALSAKVDCGVHAVAIDEERVDFTPTLWDADDRVTQHLFAGAHADVGGGYPLGEESLLSDIAGEWMGDRLAALGVNITLPIVPPGAELGPQHVEWDRHALPPFVPHPRVFPPKNTANPPQLVVSDAVMARLNQRVTVIANKPAPPTHSTWDYDPASLRNGGYP